LSIEILPVRDPGEVERFIDVPWPLFDDPRYPQWVPPLRRAVRRVLDPDLNPFFRNARMQLWIAERRGAPVGRIAAIENGWHNEFYGDRTGFFGFFECADDTEAARALFDAAADWLLHRDLASIRGPFNPSSNYEIGQLVEGYRHVPTFMTAWNPPYYAGLMERAGFSKTKDLLAWRHRVDELPHDFERHLRVLARRVVDRMSLRVRRLDLSDFDAFAAEAWGVYTSAWRGNWGFCPLELEEFRFIAGELRPLLIPEGTIGVEDRDGNLVGFTVIVPDYNRALLKNRNGRLLPLGWLRILLARRRSEWVRSMLTGVLERYQKKGVLPVILYEALRRAPDFGVTNAEFSWVLEDNDDANRTLENAGGEVYRRWRIYERDLRN